jgi:methylenetetrahydrofolate--tRNA-(uracil-5-)-methyltransferase
MVELISGAYMDRLIIIGGGLAGCEAAWQLAQRGIKVHLFEMRPTQPTGAHQTGDLAEIVCSNSLGSSLPDRPSGELLGELKQCGSLLVACAMGSRLPAGSALAVDRTAFSQLVTNRIRSHPRITLTRSEITDIPSKPVIIASGPLTSPPLSTSLAHFLGREHLFFFDAISPIVSAGSIDMQIAFRASRFDRSTLPEGDYVNCPMDEERYNQFIAGLCGARTVVLADQEREITKGVKAGRGPFFEGCLPIEILAKRGSNALAFGPLRPIGMRDPRTGKRPYAVVQLRQDNLSGSLFNLVGFQTNLAYEEQKRIFRMIPGLEHAEFIRYGQMHRNTYIESPTLLKPSMQTRVRPDVFIAGQLAGVEGYLGNIASGLVAGVNAARWLRSQSPLEFPVNTMIGALLNYICHSDPRTFQPMKANFGLLPALEPFIRSKQQRNQALAERAQKELEKFLAEYKETQS